MLTKQTRPLIPANLKIEGQGEVIEMKVTYHNRRQSDLAAEVEKAESPADTLLYILAEWEAEYPLTREGVEEAEDDRPGLIIAILIGYHDARRVEKEKN